ncbi:MAG: 50S ribosomal protein L22 [Deltaproteobacteria bacterium]|nr:50S ribosomal protein L22 [Deltaproteobacteria bacterium]
MNDTTTTKVYLRNLPIAPRKVRVVVDRIRGKRVEEALNLLQFITKLGATPVRKLLDSAIANARNNQGLDVDSLYVKTVFVDQADMLKRWTPRAQGRATKILKKNSHVTLELGVK